MGPPQKRAADGDGADISSGKCAKATNSPKAASGAAPSGAAASGTAASGAAASRAAAKFATLTNKKTVPPVEAYNGRHHSRACRKFQGVDGETSSTCALELFITLTR